MRGNVGSVFLLFLFVRGTMVTVSEKFNFIVKRLSLYALRLIFSIFT